MSGIYHGAMRRAAALLFVLSLATLLVGLYSAWRGITLASELASRLGGVLPGGLLTAAPQANWAQSMMAALNAAALPFFGAALLWRLDRSGTDRRA